MDSRHGGLDAALPGERAVSPTDLLSAQLYPDPLVVQAGKSLCCSRRLRMFFLMFLATGLHSCIRCNFNLALVAMTNDTASKSITNISQADRCPDAGYLNASVDKSGEFNWDAGQQSQLLSAFFYGYVVLQIPAGYFSERFGGKLVLALCSLLAGTGTLLVPFMARWSFDALIALRIVIGLASGPLLATVMTLVSKWFPRSEVTIIVGVIMSGFAIGLVVSFATSGLLIDSGFIGGWPSVFYIYGGVLVLWSLVWMALAADSPAKDRTISESERDYIERHTDNLGTREYENPPWCKMLTSPTVLGIWCVNLTDNYGFYVIFNEVAFYMKQMLGYDIKDNGLLISLQYCPCLLASWLICPLVDYCRKKGVISTRVARIAASLSGDLGMAGVMLAIAMFLECDRVGVTSLLMAGQFMYGTTAAGFSVSALDTAPMYAGTITGIGNFLGNLMGFAAPLVVGSIVGDPPTRQGWRTVFISTAAIMAAGVIICSIFIKGEVLHWAQTKQSDPELSSDYVDSIDDLDFTSDHSLLREGQNTNQGRYSINS